MKVASGVNYLRACTQISVSQKSSQLTYSVTFSIQFLYFIEKVRRHSSGGSVKAADTLLQDRFKEHGFSMAAFSCVQYIGTQTIVPPTDFSKLQRAVKDTIENSAVRSPRPLSVIFQALVVCIVERKQN